MIGGTAEVTVRKVCYYEVTIETKNKSGEATDWEAPPQMAAIGLIPAGEPGWGRQPGWGAHSYGYHGDDGHAFCGSGIGKVHMWAHRNSRADGVCYRHMVRSSGWVIQLDVASTTGKSKYFLR